MQTATQTNTSGATTLTTESLFGSSGNRRPVDVETTTRIVEDVSKGGSVVVAPTGEAGSSKEISAEERNARKMTLMNDIARSF